MRQKCKTKVPKKCHTAVQVSSTHRDQRALYRGLPRALPPTLVASCSILSSPPLLFPQGHPSFTPRGFRQLLPPGLPEASKEGPRTWKTSHLSPPTAVTLQHRPDSTVHPPLPQHFEVADHHTRSSENLDILNISSEPVQIAMVPSLTVTQIWEDFRKRTKGIFYKCQVQKTIRTSQLHYIKVGGGGSVKASFP